MAEIVLFHHIQGLTGGVIALADAYRRNGHEVHTPDLFEGATFDSIDEGFAYAQRIGFERLVAKAEASAAELAESVVYAGISFGVVAAQKLAQQRRGARGALLLASCLPVAEFGERWPEAVPVQIHGKNSDEYFREDLEFARELAQSAPHAELFLYPGAEHLFMDSSLNAYDEEATALLLDRSLRMLDSL